MQLLFNYSNPGVATGSYQYLRAIDMAATQWTQVKSVIVKLTFRDPPTSVNPTPQTYTFTQTYQVMYGAP
jgi:hypothetical protein